MPDLTNNTPQTARGILLSKGVFQNLATGDLATATGDTFDYFSFTTTSSSNLNLALNGLTGDAQLKVYQRQSDGSLGTELTSSATSSNTGTLAESFVQNDLAAGTYIIEVQLASGEDAANYNLQGFASADGAVNSLLLRQTSSDTLDFWQMNGVAYTGNSYVNPGIPGFEVVAVADFDGDKVEDLVWRTNNGPAADTVTIFFMNADNSVRDIQSILNGNTGAPLQFAESVQIAGVTDLDGDGKADMVLNDTVSGVIFTLQMGNGQIAVQREYRGLNGYEVAGFGDFNGDNKQDIVFRNTQGGQGLLAVWLMNGADQLSTGFVTTSLTADWTLEGIGNVNRTVGGSDSAAGADGNDDFVFRNTVTGQVAVWQMNGLQIQTPAFVGGSIPSFYQIVGVADVSGDRNVDIIWRDNSPAAQVGFWLLEGAAAKQAEFAPRQIGLEYVPTAVADFDDDGRADIFWRNTNLPGSGDPFAGSTAVWLLDGVTSKLEAFVNQPNTNPAQVQTISNNVNVVGTLKAEFTKQVQSTPGNTVATAFNIGLLEGAGDYQDKAVGLATDYFTFKLERASDVAVTLSDAFGSTATVAATVVVKRQTGLAQNGTPVLETVSSLNTPLAAGTYFIEVTGDGGALASVDYNLRVSGNPNIVNLQGAQFASVTPRSGFAGSAAGAIRLADLGGTTSQTPEADKPKASVDINFTVRNTEATQSVPFDVRFYLSRVPTIDTSNTTTVNSQTAAPTIDLGTFNVAAGVAGNSTFSGVFENVQLPAGDNNFWTTDTNYYIGYEVDSGNVVFETSETDNINRGLDIDVKQVAIENTQTPDLLGQQLILTSTPGNSTQVARGGQINLTYTVRNAGRKSTAGIANDVQVRFYLYRVDPGGQPNTLNLNDTARTRALTPVAADEGNVFLPGIPGETNTSPQTIRLELTNGNDSFWNNNPVGTRYFIAMQSDSGSLIAESSETNNFNLGLGQDSIEITVIEPIA